MEKNHIMRSFVIFTSPYVVRTIKSIRIKWAKHAASVGEKMAYGVLVRSLKEMDHIEHLGVLGKTILKRILNIIGGCGMD
jgi:hypothetical protein